MIVFLYQHNLLGRDSCFRVENHHIQIIATGHSIGHECHLNTRIIWIMLNITLFCFSNFFLLIHSHLPHIFNGASSSNRIGCDKKISRDLRHNPLISTSVNWTFLPGLAPRTKDTKRWYFYDNNINKNMLLIHINQSYIYIFFLIWLLTWAQKRQK